MQVLLLSECYNKTISLLYLLFQLTFVYFCFSPFVYIQPPYRAWEVWCTGRWGTARRQVWLVQQWRTVRTSCFLESHSSIHTNNPMPYIKPPIDLVYTWWKISWDARDWDASRSLAENRGFSGSVLPDDAWASPWVQDGTVAQNSCCFSFPIFCAQRTS